MTGEKVFEWQAINVKSPASLSGPLVWLEERYFLFPENVFAQDFNVVTLPKFTPETNPVTVQLPRRDEKGSAPQRHEAWTPLVPLTKEQAAEITAPSPTEVSEVRLSGQSSPRELLLAIKEETENHTRSRGGRDGAGEYNYRLFSTYYYAVSLDDPTQSRFASKDEWDRGKVLRSDRQPIPLDRMRETKTGQPWEYREFPKSGTSWATPMALSVGQWIALFSYTPGANHSDKMFVDIFDRRPGNNLLSTELPNTGSANALFSGALSIENDYLIVPLNTSFDSFLLWTLPGGVS